MTTQAAAISMVRTTTNRRNTTKEAPHRQRRSPLFDDEERSADCGSIDLPTERSVAEKRRRRRSFFSPLCRNEVAIAISCGTLDLDDKGKPVERRGRKASGLPILGRIHDSGVTESDANRPVACSH